MQNEPSVTYASAVILSGGKSSRMGSPKALLLFDGEPLVAHVARRLDPLFAEIVVVAAPGQELPPLPASIARDEIPHQGPVGGIYYGLNVAAGEVCFVTSCDVPFLDPALVSYLLAQIPDYDVVVPYWEERFQPLCAVYRKSVAPLLKQQLERGELRPIFLYDKVRTRKVTDDEIRRIDPAGLSFFNMNSPEDYQAALDMWKKKGEGAPLTCTVELFGVPRLLAKTKEISLSLPQAATLADVFFALAEKLPVLSGRVINSESRSLLSGYACNLNGLDFIRNSSARINSGDRIFILAADAGG
jgi:molybdopterin-guanine dinucleotide biosynthesis protein A/molybdopterin converting factor small subunit